MKLAGLVASAIKAELPITYVLDWFRLPVEGVGGQYVAVCPFHDDTDPSLDVFGEKLDRWGCFACGAKGDVFDLIGRLADLDEFSEQRALAIEMAEWLDDWPGPREGISREFNPEAVRTLVAASSVRQLGAVEQFLAMKQRKGELLGLTAKHLHEVWGVGSRGDEIIVPYWDRAGDLLTYKHRSTETKLLSAPGSPLKGVLYGEWQDRDTSRPVILTEGESDTWAAHGACADLACVMSVANGADSRPWLGELAGRSVLVAFDGDAPGRRGALRWAGYLGPTSGVLPVPDGTDLASLPPADLRERVLASGRL